MEANLPNRQSIRKKGWDYTSPGWYFVTCNTHGNQPLFGTVVNGRMVLNEAGRIAAEEWQKSAVLRADLELDEFVVMPTHVHGLLWLKGTGSMGNMHVARTAAFGRPLAGALGSVVGAYKAAVSREMHRRGLMHQTPTVHQAPPWHRNYWDVIVRDEQALANIRHYIRLNPQNFHAVMNGGEPRCLGNRALLELPIMGFLASRGEASRHGKLPVKAGEAIISGFLSPMERTIFNAGLEYRRPMIWVKPWGLQEGADATPVRQALAENRLLIVSPFDDQLTVPSARRAAWCNHYVLAHCHRLVVGHLNPDGMLACILSEADPEMKIMYL